MNIYLTKKPIFDRYNNTWGYEMSYRNNTKITKEDGTIDHMLQERANTVLYKYFRDNLSILFKNNAKAMISFPIELLNANITDILPRNKLILDITIDGLANKEMMSKIVRLKKLGYQVCITGLVCDDNANYDELIKFADYIRFSIEIDGEIVNNTIDKCKHFEKKVIVCDVETTEQYELSKDIGADYCEGYFFAQPILMTKKSGGPMIKTFLEILALLYSKTPNIDLIAAVISTDPVLTIRLLRLINKLCQGTGNTVSTVHQALVMLGLDKLKEWIYLVGLQRLNRNSPNELLRQALFRAAFCQNISRIIAGVGHRSQELYLMGLISIITGTKGAQLAEALNELPVSREIKNGLMGNGGIFTNIYYLSYNFERGNWEQVDEYTRRCKIQQDALSVSYINTMNFIDKFTNLPE